MIVLIDDLRDFKDIDNYRIARTSKAGLALLDELKDTDIDQLWLDHDLGEINGEIDDIKPVVHELERAAFHGEPYRVGVIVIHTSNTSGGDAMFKGLQVRGYRVKRVYAGDYLKQEEEW